MSYLTSVLKWNGTLVGMRTHHSKTDDIDRVEFPKDQKEYFEGDRRQRCHL